MGSTPDLGRRSAILATILSWVGVARAATPTSRHEVDVAIIGAGAAGIAAARYLRDQRRSFAVLEAGDRIGGRVHTDTAIFGVPYDMGAHWIHAAHGLTLLDLARQNGFDPYPANTDETLMIHGREATPVEYREFDRAWEAFDSAIKAAGRAGRDVAIAEVLPEGHAAWRDTVSFLLGPYACAKDLDEISTLDYWRSDERSDFYVKAGYGALVAGLAAGLPIRLNTPVLAIDSTGDRLTLSTERGTLNARRLLVTASTNVLADGLIRFTPELPATHAEALAGLRLGTYNHVAIELPGNPLGFERDEPVYLHRDGTRTMGLLTRVAGSDLCLADAAGRYGAELEHEGPEASIAAAVDLLADAFGSDIRAHVKRTHATTWGRSPYIRGAYSCAAPGKADARRTLARPIDGRVWIAGEATSPNLWGTVGGAWIEGERAAREILASL